MTDACSVSLKAQENNVWSTSASTSASPATSVSLCASTTCQSDRLLAAHTSSVDQGTKSFSSLLIRSAGSKNTRKTGTGAGFDSSAAPAATTSPFPEKRNGNNLSSYLQIPSSPYSCLIPSLVAVFGDYVFFVLVFPVTHS